jgi:hypothetical protein
MYRLKRSLSWWLSPKTPSKNPLGALSQYYFIDTARRKFVFFGEGRLPEVGRRADGSGCRSTAMGLDQSAASVLLCGNIGRVRAEQLNHRRLFWGSERQARHERERRCGRAGSQVQHAKVRQQTLPMIPMIDWKVYFNKLTTTLKYAFIIIREVFKDSDKSISTFHDIL